MQIMFVFSICNNCWTNLFMGLWNQNVLVYFDWDVYLKHFDCWRVYITRGGKKTALCKYIYLKLHNKNVMVKHVYPTLDTAYHTFENWKNTLMRLQPQRCKQTLVSALVFWIRNLNLNLYLNQLCDLKKKKAPSNYKTLDLKPFVFPCLFTESSK